MGIAEQNRTIALPRRWGTWLGWLCVAALLGVFMWRTVLPASQQTTYAFSVYYTAARLALAGQAGAQFCGEWFFAQQRALGFAERADYFCPNPPTNALALAPVAWLLPQAAQVAWLALDLAMIGGIVVIGWRLVRLALVFRSTKVHEGLPEARSILSFFVPLRGFILDSGFILDTGGRSTALWFALPAALLLVLFRPLHAELRAVQVYTLLALLYAVWLYGYLARRDRLCGLALALLVLLKFSGWPIWLLMLATRRWRALVWAIGIGVALGLAILPLLGWEFWRLYLFEQVWAIGANPTHAVPANQTLTSLLRQLFTYDPRWAPQPLVAAPWLATLIWLPVAATLLAATLIPAYRQAQAAKGWNSPPSGPIALAALCLVVPLQPAGEEYHYTMLLVALLLIFGQPWQMMRSPAVAAGLALACVLFALPSYFLQTAAWQGWPVALLAYPRLYAALILWGSLLGGRDRRLRIEDRI